MSDYEFEENGGGVHFFVFLHKSLRKDRSVSVPWIPLVFQVKMQEN